MNYNNNNKELNNYPWYLDIPHPQLYYSFSSNQSHPIIPEQQPQKQQQEEEQSQQQQEKQRNKSRGNRKLQRSRRKLRKQGINADAMARSTRESINIELSKSYQIEQPNIETTTVLVAESVFRSKTIISKKYIKNKQQQRRTTILKQKTNISRITTMDPIQLSATTATTKTESSKNTSTTTNTSFDSIDVSNETVYEMLLQAFNDDTEKLTHYLNGNQNIQFASEYINLISRLSCIKLKQSQWNWYHHIGMTRNIWTTRIPKHIAERNSICYTYGRCRRIIEQHRQKTQQQLQETQNTLQLFEQQILSKSVHPNNCCSEIQTLSSILHTFIHQNQQKLRDQLEYERQELILDATDHQLVQQFFRLKPMKSQVKRKRILF